MPRPQRWNSLRCSNKIRARLPKAGAPNGKRIACVGAGPASLTVARDLAPLGYQVTVFDADPKAGGFMRTQVPRFRLPEAVIDEETGYILDLGVQFRGGQRIESLKSLLAEGYDAVFIGCGAPRGRDLDLPGRREAAAHIHIGIDWLASVSFGHIHKTGRRVVVLGGGNTAMDCCRSARRLGGEDVKVIVRSGFEEMKASPWEKEDAIHEGIPILNYHVPVAFLHEGGQLTGMSFQIVQAVYDDKGRRSLKPKRRAHLFLQAGGHMRVRSDGPGDFADRDVFACQSQPALLTAKFVVPDRELQSERGRFGVHPMRAADHERVLVSYGLTTDDLRQFVQSR